ncbi:hypothetical protein ACIF85_08715 [Streptomyces sp. NPDC086033]
MYVISLHLRSQWLGCDLVLDFDDSPSGSEYILGWEPYWWHRYPGW